MVTMKLVRCDEFMKFVKKKILHAYNQSRSTWSRCGIAYHLTTEDIYRS